ncbi:putative glyoxalase superfamily protein PhnB [Mycolicibacterium iranicum]|uniref:Putative glyoxalase superfamily protein PhnB n=1 Tax=Mycolicibacterium iranicum TaxID=912594 RepID=A0A839Q681_MYCIR|nr:VOC family protein [Mycolicibacterium iranicum]MBB2991550.1 putative glyoxalase superfamily protein PhnB [Mycolicibacterium iranicum]
MTTGHLTAFICYRDPDALAGWICEVLGFSIVREFRDDGRLAHAELTRGDAVVCVQRDDRGYEVPAPRGDCVGSGLYVVVDEADVLDIHGRAVAHDATILVAPETTPWGNFRLELLDPEGRQWSIGTYLPGQPGDW